MTNTLIVAGILLFLTLVSFGVFVLFVLQERKRFRQRVSPLTSDLLRPPGHSLRLQVDENMSRVLSFLPVAFAFPAWVATFLAVAVCEWGFSRWYTGALVVITAGVIIWQFKKIRSFFRDANNQLAGYYGELAVAEELNQLMLEGCRVFHDVPIKYGNVDHVVVCRYGVSAINTKTLGRLNELSANPKAEVDHTNSVIRFPDRNYRIPEDRLLLEAKEVREFVSLSVGIDVQVQPILALPGWFLERKGSGRVQVINPKNPKPFFCRGQTVLSQQDVERIAFQFDKICRSVVPTNKRKASWGSDGA